ncbi:hypothetical protein MFLAVUS_010080 [Mucor flavus]|uniref:Uncharacterized protein n=1 Tax=Mucor flavus TaxID=439312 RepID=A0ABP9ZBR8_9FUNG
MEHQQKIGNAYFMKTHKIKHNAFPLNAVEIYIQNINKTSKTDAPYEGPYFIHNITRPGCYVLRDPTGKLFSRNVPTSHIKMVNKPKENEEVPHFEVQAILDHRVSL